MPTIKLNKYMFIGCVSIADVSDSGLDLSDFERVAAEFFCIHKLVLSGVFKIWNVAL